MKLHTLSLANFRGFEQLDMSFEPDMTLIAGVNGVGKSGILQALAALFARALPEFTPYTAKPPVFVDEDIHHDKPSLEASISFSVDQQRCYGGIQRIRENADFGDASGAQKKTESSVGHLLFTKAAVTWQTENPAQIKSLRNRECLQVCHARPRGGTARVHALV